MPVVNERTVKQILQSYRTGELKVVEVPAPLADEGTVLVQSSASLVSAGTEKMVMALARKSLVGKAQDRPDLVKKVFDKVSKDGVVATAKAVFAKLDQPIPLGYSLSGTVVGQGAHVVSLPPGTRVACAGAKVANHAEFNSVPVNLCVPIPENVSDETASFVTVGAIALQGVRTANLTLGERVGVIGLGLIGQLVVQLCRANGCRVLGIDLDEGKVELARKLGADRAVLRNGPLESEVARLTDGRGLDAVIVCAATDSNDPIELAGELSRDRGRIVVVGVVPMDVPRRLYYDKELSLLQSRSYGPGRYDPSYEDNGIDYPFGYVRWTEGRNMQAFLEMCASGQVQVEPLISHRFNIAQAEEAYKIVSGDVAEPFLGILLKYPNAVSEPVRKVPLNKHRTLPASGVLRASLVGSGAFASGVLLPALASKKDVKLQTVVSARGVSARHVGERFGFETCSTDAHAVLTDAVTDVMVISTRHDLHAAQAAAALKAGKAVFLEKPLAINREGLKQVLDAVRQTERPLLVDFNRRFAPLTLQLKKFFKDRTQPLTLQYRVNAGVLPADSWLHDAAVGGGRIIGEVCHFIDWCCAVADADVDRVYAESVSGAKAPLRNDDQVQLTLRLSDGSSATILYTSGGDSSMPKERMEVHGEHATAVIEDFRTLEVTRRGKTTKTRSLMKDKGHGAALDALLHAARHGGVAPIPLRSIVATTLATFGAVESLGTGRAIDVRAEADALLRGDA